MAGAGVAWWGWRLCLVAGVGAGVGWPWCRARLHCPSNRVCGLRWADYFVHKEAYPDLREVKFFVHDQLIWQWLERKHQHTGKTKLCVLKPAPLPPPPSPPRTPHAYVSR